MKNDNEYGVYGVGGDVDHAILSISQGVNEADQAWFRENRSECQEAVGMLISWHSARGDWDMADALAVMAYGNKFPCILAKGLNVWYSDFGGLMCEHPSYLGGEVFVNLCGGRVSGGDNPCRSYDTPTQAILAYAEAIIRLRGDNDQKNRERLSGGCKA